MSIPNKKDRKEERRKKKEIKEWILDIKKRIYRPT